MLRIYLNPIKENWKMSNMSPVGLGNTRFSTDYAQKFPRTLRWRMASYKLLTTTVLPIQKPGKKIKKMWWYEHCDASVHRWWLQAGCRKGMEEVPAGRLCFIIACKYQLVHIYRSRQSLMSRQTLQKHLIKFTVLSCVKFCHCALVHFFM